MQCVDALSTTTTTTRQAHLVTQAPHCVARVRGGRRLAGRMEAALLARSMSSGSSGEGGGASSLSSWAAGAAPDVLLGVGRPGAREGLAFVALGLLIGVVIISLFPARSPPSEPSSPSPKAQMAISTNSPSEGASAALPSSLQEQQQRRGRAPEQEESVVAALADEGKWIRRFSGWQAALGLSDEQLQAAVARARAEAAGASSSSAAAAAAAAAGGGNALGSGAILAEKQRQRDDAAADYGSLSARVDLLFYFVAFAALIYFVQRDYGGSPSLLPPAGAALGGGAGSGGGGEL